MTSEQKLARISALATQHVDDNGQSKSSAKKALVREGFFTARGSLSSNYGGAGTVTKSAKPAVKS